LTLPIDAAATPELWTAWVHCMASLQADDNEVTTASMRIHPPFPLQVPSKG